MCMCVCALPSILNKIIYISVCGGTFLSSFGVLTSPNYPAMYPTSKTCEYIIMTRQGQQILLNVTDFSLESSSGCNEADYLEIR